MEPIRQVVSDYNREHRLAGYFEQALPWVLTPTPKFYFTDYHINKKEPGNRQTYIGDLEIKWLNTASSFGSVFNYNKLQLMAAVPVYTDTSDSYHRVCFRFTDGILLVPALSLMRLKPMLFTRQDTAETDMVVKVNVNDFRSCFRPVRVE